MCSGSACILNTMIGWLLEVYVLATSEVIKYREITHINPSNIDTRWGGQMSRVSASCAGRSENPNLAGSNPDPGQAKLMTLKLMLVAFYPGARHY